MGGTRVPAHGSILLCLVFEQSFEKPFDAAHAGRSIFLCVREILALRSNVFYTGQLLIF